MIKSILDKVKFLYFQAKAQKMLYENHMTLKTLEANYEFNLDLKDKLLETQEMFLNKFNETPEDRLLRKVIENLQNELTIVDEIVIKQVQILTDIAKMTEEQISHFAQKNYTLVINADVNIKQALFKTNYAIEGVKKTLNNAIKNYKV